MLIVCSLITILVLLLVIYAKLAVVLLGLLLLILGLSIFGIQFCIKKWMENKPAFIINSRGVWDNSTALSVGWIEWEQIKEFKVNHQSRMIAVILKDSRYFIDIEYNWLKKALMMLNWKLDESPVHFNDRLIEMSYKELLKELKVHQNKDRYFDDLSRHLLDDNG